MPRFSKLLQTTALAFSLSTTLHAQPFRTEITAGTFDTAETGNMGESSGFNLAGKYYFSEVNAPALPLREARFGSRASHVRLAYSQQDTESSERIITPVLPPDAPLGVYPVIVRSPGITARQIDLGGEYINSAQGWILGVSAKSGEGESSLSSKQQGYRISIGKYLAQNTTLRIGFSNTENDSDRQIQSICPYSPFSYFPGSGFPDPYLRISPNPATFPVISFRNPDDSPVFIRSPNPRNFSVGTIASCYTLAQDIESEARSWNADFRHLQKIGNYYFAWGLHYSNTETTTRLDVINDSPFMFVGMPLSQSTSSDADNIGGDITAYINRRLSVTLGYNRLDSASSLTSDTDHYNMALEYFIVPEIGVQLGYSFMNAGNSSVPVPFGVFPSTINTKNDQETFRLGLRGRF